ncbi:DUF6090 family protein [Winogradskyella alexanderae]|uniref:Uncharacterized protein n=1 Tax=Winogradskyella alexanderae TaxID=2877123 RepID=A0ABS7XUX1_9FLAO|nr:DUF6090 family protein [Winogradskyella alexanderae]MCA0133810.1 hypothetical protein [Winogradskyella alexanderae]
MQNKSSKYLKYAIGEILLVVIGILIAVQINNWNESRKSQFQETKLVKQLLQDAIADSLFFQSRIQFQKMNDTLFNDLINFSMNPESDSIANRSVNASPFFSRLAYQSNLINNNPDAYDQVSNDSIKHKLRQYNARYEYVVQSIELSNRIREQYGLPLQIANSQKLNDLLDNTEVKIKDLDFITNDKNAISTINQFKNFGLNYLIQVQNFLVVNEELKQMLSRYLNNNE